MKWGIEVAKKSLSSVQAIDLPVPPFLQQHRGL
jgi:hypothetical protein